MASTTFIDNQTVIYAAWLNDVNNAVYNGIFASSSITATSMICTGTASGSGFTNLINNSLSSPGAIGSGTPNTGAFTTLTASQLTASTPIGISSGGTGLSSVGTSGYGLFSNGTGLTYKKLGLGMSGETWHDVSGSRSAGVTYTNSRTYPISVSIIFAGYGPAAELQINGVINSYFATSNSAYGDCTVSAIIPPGSTYLFVLDNGTSLTGTWSELY
jgi:hypothetical protein